VNAASISPQIGAPWNVNARLHVPLPCIGEARTEFEERIDDEDVPSAAVERFSRVWLLARMHAEVRLALPRTVSRETPSRE
jgi:hypothetical protein